MTTFGRDIPRGSDTEVAPSLPTYDPATHVLVERITETEARSQFALLEAFASGANIAVVMLSQRGIIRPDTITDRYERETGNPVTPEVAAALAWVEAGEQAGRAGK